MKKIILISLFIVSLVSCSKSRYVEKSLYAAEAEYADEYAGEYVTDSFSGTGYNGNSVSSMKKSNSYTFIDESYNDSPVSSEGAASEIIERKLIRNGTISIIVESMEDSDSKIEAWIKSLGGYISNSQMNKYYNYYTVRIPSERFDEAMKFIGGLGELQNRSVYIEDVTDRWYDLKGRLETKKILEEKYNQYLKKADNMKDLLEVERQLNNVISEIESMEGQMKRLNNQIDYSTINITVEAKVPTYDTQRHVISLNLKDFMYDVGDFFVKFAKVLLGIVIYGIPILALLALLYWVLFGKIGLLKKLFIFLSGKKKADGKAGSNIKKSSGGEKSDE